MKQIQNFFIFNISCDLIASLLFKILENNKKLFASWWIIFSISINRKVINFVFLQFVEITFAIYLSL